MGLSLKKLTRGIGKLVKPIAIQAIKATPVGGAAMRALTALKATGVNLRAATKKVQPLSVRASIEKVKLSPKRTLEAPGPLGLVKPRATTRRRKKAPMSTDMDIVRATGIDPVTGQRVGKPRKRRKKVTTNGAAKPKRKPPGGGLDLKAMAAAWRAAGKPGTWISWIKANPIKRAA